jgi:phosphatidylglycerophosphatase A
MGALGLKEHVIALLRKRGVTSEQIAEITYTLQKPYSSELRLEQCLECVDSVLSKREVQYTLLTGIALDMLAEQNLLPEPLLSTIKRDEGLYGVDEVLALGITNLYGTIGLTSFGYLDKTKIGVIGTLNACRHDEAVHTFLDDLVAGVAAAASSKIAHCNLSPDEEAEEV